MCALKRLYLSFVNYALVEKKSFIPIQPSLMPSMEIKKPEHCMVIWCSGLVELLLSDPDIGEAELR
jgi:hypothetical protein